LHADRTDGTVITSTGSASIPTCLPFRRSRSAASRRSRCPAQRQRRRLQLERRRLPGSHGADDGAQRARLGHRLLAQRQAAGGRDQRGDRAVLEHPRRVDRAAGTSISVGSSNTIAEIAFSPGSDFVALAFGMQAEIWNVATRTFVSAAHAHGARRRHLEHHLFGDVFGQRRRPGGGRRDVRQGAGLRGLTGD
jgi:hypothetical protein